MDTTPLFLSEATTSLYPVDANGNPITDSPIWIGSLATNLNLKFSLEEDLSFASGDNYKTAHHTDEMHVIEIARNWFTRTPSMGEIDFPLRNTNYVLAIVWNAQDEFKNWYWFSRVYYGVTARSMDLNSTGTRHFLQPQSFRAQYFTQTGGTGTSDVFPPVNITAVQEVLFMQEDPLMVGDYLMGTYRWPSARVILSAKIIALASQVAGMQIALEVNGTLTSTVLTLATGTANTEVSDEIVDINLTVPIGQNVRWKITGGPGDPALAAWKAGIVMVVQ